MKKRFLLSISFTLFALMHIFADPVDRQSARRVALAWLNTNPAFLRSNIVYTPASEILELWDDDHTQIIAYVLQLEPRGFIITTPNSEINPIIAYSEMAVFDPADVQENTLLFLLRSDVSNRIEALEQEAISYPDRSEAKSLWAKYLDMVDGQGRLLSKSAVTLSYDVEHGPLLSSEWGQSLDGGGNAAFNYYTPNTGDGNSSNYVCGCVATAFGQILNYYEWPPTGTGSYSYTWDNGSDPSETLSANFGATTYDWTNILDSLHTTAKSETERQAVGRLVYHCGVAVDMNYASGGSSAMTSKVAWALKDYFRGSGEYVLNTGNFYDRLYDNMVAHRSGELSITGEEGGHAVVVDGVRHDTGQTKYYHLNMGWSGTDDAWYDLPNVTSSPSFNTVHGAVLDIVPTPDLTDPGTTTASANFTVSWNVSSNLNATKYELQQAPMAATTSTLTDDAEGGTGNWLIDGNWETSTREYHGGSQSFRGYFSPSAMQSTMQLDKVLKIDATTSITYWWRTDSFYPTGKSAEARLEISTDGFSWSTLESHTAENSDAWAQETVSSGDLAAYQGNVAYLRFWIINTGDTYYNGDTFDFVGFFFDDFTVNNVYRGDWTTVDNNIMTTSKDVIATSNSDYFFRVRANWNSQWWRWSDYESITVDDPSLPVELIAFSARVTDPGVLLNWTTESEVGNLGFILERQGNGESDWLTIAGYKTHDALKGRGNTSSRSEYAFMDVNVYAGTTYLYRLSDVSFEGEVTVDDVLEITVTDEVIPAFTKLEPAYPNPFNPETKISLKLAEDVRVSLVVFDLRGRIVTHILQNEFQRAGTYSYLWNGRDDLGRLAPSGMYMLVLNTEYVKKAQKVMLVR